MLKISIVIPTYKRPSLLKRCLDALEEQSLDASCYEVIVVTDGPDNSTTKLVDSYCRGNFSSMALSHKKGPAAARNMGWRNASASLIAFTDDDTIPAKNWLRGFLDAYQNEDLLAFTGKVIVPLKDKPTDYEKNTARLETADFVTANCFCTRAALEKVNGFDEDFETAWREDSDLEFRLLEAGIPIKHIENAAIIHPIRKAGWGVCLKEQKKSLYNALLFKKHPQLYKEKIMAKPLWNYYIMTFLVLTFSTAALFNEGTLSFSSFIFWLMLVINFTARRLRGTSHSFNHVMEMFITSMLIPFLSVYWTLRGARRYKVLFL